MENSLAIVIVGHVDHGKSTLIGRLLYDTNSIPPERIEEIKETSESLGKEMEFAFLMDYLKEERTRGITIDTSQIFFKTDKRRYVIIDAPGHKEFLKNMITGASHAEAAILLIDAYEGIRDQTYRHCHILRLLGIEQVACLINKMDLVDFSESRFNEISDQISSILKGLGIVTSFIVPISARYGDNVTSMSKRLPWYNGPTVLRSLDSFQGIKIEEKNLRFSVQDNYEIDKKRIVVGRVESGTLSKEKELMLLPEGERLSLLSIEKFLRDKIEIAYAGESIGLLFEGEKIINRGNIIVDSEGATIKDSLFAHIFFWMADDNLSRGEYLTFKCTTQEARCQITSIKRRYDPGLEEVEEKNASAIRGGEIAEVEITLERPLLIDKFQEIPETGRFVLERKEVPVAGGIIIS